MNGHMDAERENLQFLCLRIYTGSQQSECGSSPWLRVISSALSTIQMLMSSGDTLINTFKNTVVPTEYPLPQSSWHVKLAITGTQGHIWEKLSFSLSILKEGMGAEGRHEMGMWVFMHVKERETNNPELLMDYKAIQRSTKSQFWQLGDFKQLSKDIHSQNGSYRIQSHLKMKQNKHWKEKEKKKTILHPHDKIAGLSRKTRNPWPIEYECWQQAIKAADKTLVGSAYQLCT